MRSIHSNSVTTRSFLRSARLLVNLFRMKLILAMILVAMMVHPLARGGEVHEAAELGNLAKVKTLLAQDPKLIDSTDAKGRTLLSRALLSGKKELLDFLLEKGATEEVFTAAAVGHTEKLATFLKEDPKLVGGRDASGMSALHWAALYGQKPSVASLLAAKADVHALDADGFTPLHWATMFNKSETVELLLANKADSTMKIEKYGWTPLRLAVIHGHLATAKVLLKGGADANLKDASQIPLLHQAIIVGRKEMVELLLDYKSDINYRDGEGETPLSEAIEQGRGEIIQLLRQRGAREK